MPIMRGAIALFLYAAVVSGVSALVVVKLGDKGVLLAPMAAAAITFAMSAAIALLRHRNPRAARRLHITALLLIIVFLGVFTVGSINSLKASVVTGDVADNPQGARNAQEKASALKGNALFSLAALSGLAAVVMFALIPNVEDDARTAVVSVGASSSDASSR